MRSMLSRLPDPLPDVSERLALTHELIRITTMDMIAEYLLANSKKNKKKTNQTKERTGLPLTPAERYYIILEPVMVTYPWPVCI